MRAGVASRLALYRTLTEVALVEAEDGGHILAAVHPSDSSLGTLGVPEGGEAGLAIRAGERWLRARGCTRALGPMEVCTWFPYRARLGAPEAASFPGEPTASPTPWQQAGYAVHAHYASTVLPCETGEPEPPPRGLQVRRVREPGTALALIHRLSHAAFASALGFAPLPLPVLEAVSQAQLAQVESGAVLLAEREGEPVAFVLGFPEAADSGRFIIKTLAVHPSAQGRGVGAWLTAALHHEAARRGFREVVHALMWEGSHSQRIQRGRARLLREYHLYGRSL